LGAALIGAAVWLPGRAAVAQVDWEEGPPPDQAGEPASAPTTLPEPEEGRLPPPPPPPEPEDTKAAPTEPAPPAPSERMVLNVPPPPPPTRPRSRRLHDGFYLRMTSGPGWLSTSVDFDSGAHAAFRGTGLNLDLMAGGTPTPGLTIGGGGWLGSADEPEVDFEVSGSTEQEPVYRSSMAYGVLGAFIDVYPNPRTGFHFGAAFGVGFVTLPAREGAPDDDPGNGAGGGGAVLFGGYDFWLTTNWSLGGMLRLMAIEARNGSEDADMPFEASARSAAVLFSALYH
jgi:hypothetical protein